MKRVPDVLSSPDLTKKVLREVCILRRLNHPFIISLRDAFLRPSASGAACTALCFPLVWSVDLRSLVSVTKAHMKELV